MRRSHWSLILAMIASCFVDCGGRTDGTLGGELPGERCVPGLQINCGCPGGDVGVQGCLPNGTFGSCKCPTRPPVGGSGGASGDGGTTGIAGGSAGPDGGVDASAGASGSGGASDDGGIGGAAASGGTGDDGGAGTATGADAGSAGGGAAGTGGASGSGGSVGCGLTTGVLDAGTGGSGPIEVDIPARALVADPARGVLYATVDGASATYGNSLVVIDAASGQIITSVFVGSQPLTMALSDDASTLWVSLQGSYQIRRVDLKSGSPVPGPQYGLPQSSYGELAYAGPMVVLPGTTESVAISLHTENLSPSYMGSVVLDSGVPRPLTTPGHTGASRLTGGPLGWLFGYNNLHSGFGFYSLAVSPAGLTSIEFQGLISGYYVDIVYANNRVYATSGDIVDVSNPTLPTKAGKFAFSGYAVLPIPGVPCVLMATPSTLSSGPITLRLFDAQTFTQIDLNTYPTLNLDSADDLVTTDGKVLALRGNAYSQPTKVYLLTNPFAGK